MYGIPRREGNLNSINTSRDCLDYRQTGCIQHHPGRLANPDHYPVKTSDFTQYWGLVESQDRSDCSDETPMSTHSWEIEQRYQNAKAGQLSTSIQSQYRSSWCYSVNQYFKTLVIHKSLDKTRLSVHNTRQLVKRFNSSSQPNND